MKKVCTVILTILIIATVLILGIKMFGAWMFDSLFKTYQWDINEVSHEQRLAALIYTHLEDYDNVRVESISAFESWSAHDSSICITISVDSGDSSNFTPIAEKAGYTTEDSNDIKDIKYYRYFEEGVGSLTIKKIIGSEAYNR